MIPERKRRWLSVAVTGLMLAVGVWQFQVLTVDQTAARQANQRFDRTLEGAQIGLWEWDCTEGMGTGTIWFPKEFPQRLGYEKSELPVEWAELVKMVHPDDWPRVRAAMQAALDGQTPRYEAKYRLRKKNGQYIWVFTRGEVNADKTRMSGSVIDIDELTHTQEMLDVIVEIVPTAVIVCNEKGEILYFNPGAEELFHYTFEELKGKPFNILIDKSIREDHNVAYAKAVAEINASAGNWEMTRRCLPGKGRCRDGTVFGVFLALRGIKFENTIRFIAVITPTDYHLHDKTNLRPIQQLPQRSFDK